MASTVPSAPRPSWLGPRSAPILLLGVLYLVLGLLLRLGLSFWEWGPAELTPLGLAAVLGAGVARDLLAFSWIAIAPALLLWLVPGRWFGGHLFRLCIHLALYVAALLLVFSLTAEVLFWEEFQTRFNFIAVDYLIYTREVVGNIVESYPLVVILPGQALAALLLLLAIRRPLGRALERPAGRGRALVPLAGLVALAVVDSALPVPSTSGAPFPNRYQGQLAANGLASLVRAYRDPILDYEVFYRSLPEDQAYGRLRTLLAQQPGEFVDDDPRHLDRIIESEGPERDLNVVLVVVESLSAKFLGCYGNSDGLTPRLDALAPETLRYTNLFATGCRTVRGLEAVSLSVPPTPGRSILHRDHNEDLFSIGWPFRERGYDTKFFYGGRSYFDGMDHFYAHNGFDVVDRSDLSDDEVTFQNAWGVCDEDLFGRVLRDADESTAAGGASSRS